MGSDRAAPLDGPAGRRYVLDGVLRAVIGAVFVIVPQRIARLASSSARVHRGVTGTVVVLGSRHLLEAVVLARRPRADVARWVTVVDLTHAATMLALAGASRTYRRPALTSAAAATALAALGAITASPPGARATARADERTTR